MIDKAYYICDGDVITTEYLSDEIRGSVENVKEKNKYGTINYMEKDLIIETILKNNGNITRSASELGISKPTIYRKMKKYNIASEDFKKR